MRLAPQVAKRTAEHVSEMAQLADLWLPRRSAGPCTWEPSTRLSETLPASEKVPSHAPIIADGLWSRHSTHVSHSLQHRPEQQQQRSSGAQGRAEQPGKALGRPFRGLTSEQRVREAGRGRPR